MLWFIGIAFLGLILFNFFSDVKKQESQMAAQGGVRQKYSTLVNLLLGTMMGGKIFSERSDSLGIGKSHPVGGTNKYFLTQTFGKLTIEYTMENPMFGKHKFEWVFNENTDQTVMFEKMKNDIESYLTSKFKM